jgi:hypothetical protein
MPIDLKYHLADTGELYREIKMSSVLSNLYLTPEQRAKRIAMINAMPVEDLPYYDPVEDVMWKGPTETPPEVFIEDVTESYKVAYIPYSVVSMYTTAPYTGTQPVIPVLYNPEVLEQARKKGEERRK